MKFIMNQRIFDTEDASILYQSLVNEDDYQQTLYRTKGGSYFVVEKTYDEYSSKLFSTEAYTIQWLIDLLTCYGEKLTQSNIDTLEEAFPRMREV